MATTGAAAKLVFTFPGQGSYSHDVLRELFDSYPYQKEFAKADEICKRILGHEFLSLVRASSPEEQLAVLRECQDLDQVAIYLSEILIADVLMQAGLRPDLLLGHSFGELAALSVAGAFSIENGLRIVCQRSAALQPQGSAGRMAAVSCDADRAAAILQSLPNSHLSIAVINHSKQTVVSGPAAELDELSTAMARQGIGVTALKARYPFHSPLLQPVVRPFRLSLGSYAFQPPEIPVYLGTEQRLLAAPEDLDRALSEQLIRQLNFSAILGKLQADGFHRFVECGAGNIVTKVVQHALSAQPDLLCRTAAAPGQSVKDGAREILQEFRVAGPVAATLQDSMADVATLLRDARSVMERTSRLLERIPVPPAPEPAVETPLPVARPAERCPVTPIAIVAHGCVLPGARNPEEYWNNIVNGVSGIVDLAAADESMARDFLAGTENKIVADKTYTLLHGSVGSVAYDRQLLSGRYTEAAFDGLTRGEKLLAIAAAQSLAGVKRDIASYGPGRVQCVLGATADGVSEYDDTLFLQSIDARLAEVEPDPARRTACSATLRDAWGLPAGETPRPPQHESYQAVMRTVLGAPLRTYIVDAACSSSLYAINLGMKALARGDSDVVIAGGVFAPGPANNTLFAQFRGLTPTASRPFDAAADGVVFGDGAGILILKRLTDAIADGDHVIAVIRSMGLSSDGKSPAINVPQSNGQALAVRRAYEKAAIDPNTIQYVEAHATSTPVGDAVEFAALRQALPRDPSLPPIELGSVKALIGHTGWAAGVASVIKLCKAFEKGVTPSQHNYTGSGPEIPLSGSQFTISTAAHPWPANIASLPPRAAVNGFGFGGTNAHLILEKYDAAYHRSLVPATGAKAAGPVTLAVVAATSLFPAAGAFDSPDPVASQHQFARPSMPLPKGKMLLPDVKEHMDAGQYLALLAAERSLSTLAAGWKQLKNGIGVVVGVESKTERGVTANQRIFLDRLQRRIAEAPDTPAARDLRDRVLPKLSAAIRDRILPSGPYTLPGLMPNVVSGRVANMYDLNGPNVVVDMGANSLFQAILVAAEFLDAGDCTLVLTGAVNALRLSPQDAEGGFLMALTTPEIARDHGLPVKCLLAIDPTGAIAGASTGDTLRAVDSVSYRGAAGIRELSEAVSRAGNGQACSVAERVAGDGPATTFTLSQTALQQQPGEQKAQPREPKAQPRAAEPAPSSPYAYVQGTPIDYYTPVRVPAALASAANPAGSLRKRKILFLIDQPDRWKLLESSGALDGIDYLVISPGATLRQGLAVDFTSDQAARGSLEALPVSLDTIVAVKFLDHQTASSFLISSADGDSVLLDLLFAVSRHAYENIQARKTAIASLCIDAGCDGRLQPATGLLSGFMKSLARELPGATCRIVNTVETDFRKALLQVEAEMSRASELTEVVYTAAGRHVLQFARLEQAAEGSEPLLTANSVVLATGGGRGVTAVLVEELLRRFQCTVVALGRTDPASAPPEILAMSEQELAVYEQQFYKDELARGKGGKITQLRERYRAYQAAHEVHQTVRSLAALGGRFEYVPVDIADRDAVGRAVAAVYSRYGAIDLVLHGAGIQKSKALTKKTIEEFRSVVRAKLTSLGHIHAACERLRNGRTLHYHILTSAFSSMGNDGQPDYGAANEALNRVADLMNASASNGIWCSVAWLGWAGIGMTRGSEYAALAASRGLRGVTKEEGQEIFSRLLAGTPTAAINLLLAEGEIKFYDVPIAPAPFAKAVPSHVAAQQTAGDIKHKIIEREITVEEAPYVLDHCVDGIPTLPGAFLIMMIAEAALELRPNLKITAFEDAAFRRFVRLQKNGPTRLRLSSTVAAEDGRSTLVRVEVLADFVHKNGMVLQKDAVQTAISVRMASVLEPPLRHNGGSGRANGRLMDDPYVMDGSPVRLDGPFRTMKNIVAGETYRTAEYKPSGSVQSSEGYCRFLPNLLMMDSLWRFGAIEVNEENAMPVYVPEACRVMRVYYDLSSRDAFKVNGGLTLAGSNPHEEEDRLLIGPVEARDSSGATLLMVDGGVCRRIGEVRNGH